MKSTIVRLLKIGVLFSVGAILFWTALTTISLSSIEKLESSIKEEKSLVSSTYTYKTWTPEQIEKIIIPISNEKKRGEVKEKLDKEETRVVYFYLNKKSIEYFISAELKEKNEDSYCRLVVRSNFFLMTWLNKVNILVNQNYKEHRIDKSICNALYGFGKPSL